MFILLVKNSHWLLVLMCVFLAGCATNRSAITLKSSIAAPAKATVPTGQTAVIRIVKDDRVFEEKPKDASIPSLGFGGAANSSAELKASAVGRKRNGFGKALGDVTLENGKTVDGVIRERLTLALQQAGYEVKQDDQAVNPTLVLDVNIKQFWAWIQPGFWAITVHTKIETDLNVAGLSTPININTHVQESRQIVPDSAWISILSKGLDDYQTKVSVELAKLPSSASTKTQ